MNYILLVVVAVCAALLRRPWSVPPAATLAAAAAVQNDTFAAAASEAVLRGLRRLHGRTAARLRLAAGGANTSGVGWGHTDACSQSYFPASRGFARCCNQRCVKL